MNGPSYFEIQVDDIQRAINFYQTIFEWKFTKDESLPIEYWRIETSTSRGGLLKRPTATPGPMSGTNAYVCSMEVKNFDETSKHILENGGQVALEKFAVDNVCWQGYFLDAEGNTFGIFEPDPNAK